MSDNLDRPVFLHGKLAKMFTGTIVSTFAGFCTLGMVSISALAQPAQGDGADVAAIDLSDLKATVIINVVDGGATTVSVKERGESFPVDIEENGDTLFVHGAEPLKKDAYRSLYKGGWGGYDGDRMADYLSDYPVITITMPAGTDVTLQKSIMRVSAGDGLGDLEIGKGIIGGTVGNVQSADIRLSSSEDIQLGMVQGSLKATLSGSGDFTAEDAGQGDFVLSGSGDVTMGKIVGDASFVLSGSGDVEARDIGGAAEFLLSGSGDIAARAIGSGLNATLSGSGDVDVDDIGGPVIVTVSGSGDVAGGDVKGGAEMRVSGSGGIMLASVNGQTNARISGNGDIDIADGMAEDLTIYISGNGRFVHQGQATNLDVSMNGSGSVDVYENTGTLTTNARSGRIRVNGQKIDTRRRHN